MIRRGRPQTIRTALGRAPLARYDRDIRIGAFPGFGASHIRLWMAAVALVAAIGSIGYVALGWPIGDAIYMTGITLTTVGYREVRELDGLGRAWTVLVAVAGVGIIFGSVGWSRKPSCRMSSVDGGRQSGWPTPLRA